MRNASDHPHPAEQRRQTGHRPYTDRYGANDSLSRAALTPYVPAEFKAFTSSFPPDMAGETLNCQPAIRTAHNSFKRYAWGMHGVAGTWVISFVWRRPEPFVFEKQLATDDVRSQGCCVCVDVQ